MAGQIPFGVVVNIIDKLGSLAFCEIARIYGVKEELEKLQTTIQRIQAALSDAEKRQLDDGDALIKNWILSLREVVNDADNLFGDLLIEQTRRKVKSHGQVRVFFSSKNQLLFRRKMARKVQEIRNKFDDLSGDISKLNLVLTSGYKHNKLSEGTWRDTDSSVLESDIVGREENKKEIIDLLKQPNTNQKVSLIAIVGIGGLGKTALAQLIYNDAAVKGLFKKKMMWVCVSEDFDVKSILKQMLKSLEVKEAVDGFNLEQLQKNLHEALNGQKYMLVLDDIWNQSSLEWDKLRKYLMCGCEGSKILVTTRSKKVAQIMGIDDPYDLGGLTKQESWNLLKKVAFGDDTSRVSQDVESIGKGIAEKCAGVPLAIKTVGGLLRSNHEEAEWKRVLDGDFWRLCAEKESIMPVLKLSYQNLPLELRQCFVYCCLYPKDSIIDSNELIQLWMAQGFLESSKGIDSLDKGIQYIKFLLMRSFFQEACVNQYGDIKSFKMHDLMHDLAKSIGGNDCCYLENGEEGIVGKPMHIALADSTSCSLSSVDTSHLRTLVFPNMQVQLSSNPSLIKSLKYLRALNLSKSSITRLPDFIDKLKHLKYIDLCFCRNLTSIPASIGNLVSLQTLKLNWCDELAFPTQVITMLINLRRFEFHNCKAFETKMPLGLGKLTSLQHISHFVVAAEPESDKCKSGSLNELKELNQIRGKLTIKNLGSVKEVQSDSQEANLRAKQHIQNLQLIWGINKYRDMIENKNSDSLELLNNLCPPHNLKKLTVHRYPGMRFSCWVSSLSNVVQISLHHFSSCEDLPPLERLRCLQTLELKWMDELRWIYYEENSSVFFPSLKTLTFFECRKLRGWRRWGDNNKESETDDHLSLPLSFSCLSHLELSGCPSMTCMPTFPHLDKSLWLEDCSVKALKETCLVGSESCTLYPLSALMELNINHVRDIESMPEEWMQNLKSLHHLSIGISSVVPILSRQLQHLPSQLHSLTIWGVNELVVWKDDEDGDCTPCQASFYCLHSLQTLSFEFCRNMKALPAQIGKLQSLKHISISYCGKLESLPEGMRHLSNLQTLEIKLCPILSERCKAESGQDWPKIAHIPSIRIS
ncbi:hypothetical protein PIB30_034598 [Stylosanthes scabra]|uniref:Uncharacterized protein n=1 Tax=Stylosanthes scabra TaxID=79078 RepID=A0ABU6VAV5_9FABA|nr:hypothetical protein [Stylosanthes scabra]